MTIKYQMLSSRDFKDFFNVFYRDSFDDFLDFSSFSSFWVSVYFTCHHGVSIVYYVYCEVTFSVGTSYDYYAYRRPSSSVSFSSSSFSWSFKSWSWDKRFRHWGHQWFHWYFSFFSFLLCHFSGLNGVETLRVVFLFPFH